MLVVRRESHNLAKGHVWVLPVVVVQRWVGANLGLAGDISVDGDVQQVFGTEVSPDVLGREAEVGCLFAIGQVDSCQAIFEIYKYGAREREEGGNGQDEDKGKECA